MARTLSIDIGGSKIKAMILDPKGNAVSERERMKTPKNPTPEAVLKGMMSLAGKLGDFERVSVGFPGAVREGVIETAPNLGTEAWHGFNLQAELAERLGKPVRVANDATVQGYGAITGKGVELVLTLGTGLGTTLFVNGLAVPNLELAHHPFRRGKTYEELLGRNALERDGVKKWNKALKQALDQLFRLFYFDSVAIGGGNTDLIDFKLPSNARIIPNIAGILGGVRLWDPPLGA
jgi:polyphosphate glucokinase